MKTTSKVNNDFLRHLSVLSKFLFLFIGVTNFLMLWKVKKTGSDFIEDTELSVVNYNTSFPFYRTFKKTLLLLFISYSSYAQVEIKGIIKDSSNVAIEFANVVLTNQKNEFVKGTITDNKGQFNLFVEKGDYMCTISFIGYENWTKDVFINKPKNFGVINLIENKNELDEVVLSVRKRLIEQKADRLVFNLENSAISSGGDALEALKITPGVLVQNSTITLIGKQNVRVMINDRILQLTGDDLIAYLASIASDDIKTIEVITAPPSKYDAEGNSGLINIQLKKPKENSWNNNIRAAYIQTTYPAYTFGNTFSYNRGKIQLTATINGKKGNEGQITTSDIDFPTGPWIGKLKYKKQQDFVSARFGFDYTISDKSSVGVLYSGTVSNKDINDNNRTDIYDTTNNQTGTIISNGYNDADGQNHSINTHYIHKLDTIGRTISVDVDYFKFKKNQNRIFDNDRTETVEEYSKANNVSNQDIDNYSAKIDVEHPFSWGDFAYGTKVSFIETDNIIEFYDLTDGVAKFDPTQSDNFKYKENTQSLYLDFTKTFGEKWQIKGGLRLENTQTTGLSLSNNEENKSDYTNLFPTLYAIYTKNQNNIFNFNYSKRISRPAYWELNPFRWYTNTYSYSEGNPFLRPEISTNFELKHTYKSTLISEVFLTFADDCFGQIPSVDPITNEQIYTRDNYYKFYVFGLKETFLYNPFNWWHTVSQASITTIDPSFLQGVDLETDILEGTYFTFYNNHTLFFNSDKTIQGNVTFQYRSPQTMLIYEVSSSVSLDLGLKFFFLDKKLQCSITVNDVFKSSAYDVTTYTNNIKQVFNTYSDNRYLKIGVNYRFGNKKISVKNRSFGNQQEKNRAN